MKSQYKPFLISLLIELFFALLFRKTEWLGYNNEILFWDHIIEWILIFIIWPIIGLIWNTKEKNTKYLKFGLIFLEIYLFLLIFIQDWSNLNKREFFVLYAAILLIIKETIYKRPKRRQSISYLTIYYTISLIIISIWIFMQYREPLDINKILNNQEYIFVTNFYDINNNYNSITLKNNFFIDNINIFSWKNNYKILKNMDYSLDFLSEKYTDKNYIIIQDQLWNIVKIYPQTSINFSTYNKNIQYIDKKKNTEYYWINENFPKELEEYKTIYKETIKNEVLKTLPVILRTNWKFQKISVNYTKFLWTIFPFWYGENKKIVNDYIPYFDIQEYKEYESLKDKFSILKNNESIWIKNINWWSKYKFF